MAGITLDEKARLFDLLIHDLTGPLAVISASSTALLTNTERNGSLTDRQRTGLDRILRNAGKAQGILREMLEVLRAEAGVFRREPFRVETLLKESILDVLEIDSSGLAETLRRTDDVNAFRVQLKAHGILVEITGRYRDTPFPHDPGKIRYVLRNLLRNAVKFRRSRIQVIVGGDADLLVSVEDDGPGIPQGQQEAVFERFVQLDGKNHSDAAGLGLGLAGAKALVEAMGGKIALESEAGAGARFSVRIPPLRSSESAV